VKVIRKERRSAKSLSAIFIYLGAVLRFDLCTPKRGDKWFLMDSDDQF
jgi:hypothetical protein